MIHTDYIKNKEHDQYETITIQHNKLCIDITVIYSYTEQQNRLNDKLVMIDMLNMLSDNCHDV